ncbi:NACHT, LRR and PYD domains-containing protein 1 homolog [Salvelinus fontinalis]|uniref:NACHT, LRR and PYD domains-containing protein 1 homolog n=1 Tax=Salvelinus fontinalis TaxID=8038 RepID=UPI00248534C5|nr:NACHT, LRR and PYD domains-containing protein 1 homolog [Salvelinus fontinalis]
MLFSPALDSICVQETGPICITDMLVLVQDSTHWLQIEPLTSTVQGVTMFRHRTPKGSYECTVSGLRWLCERDVILKYHFRNWEHYSQLLQDMQYTQGGPLLDITMELGELEEVHLPHFVCLGTNPSLRNEMKILHVEEHGVSFEEVHEVTRFHAKILHPKFSSVSVVLNYIACWNVDVHCDGILYLAVKRSTVISRLYLLLRNSSQKEAVQEREKNQLSQGYSEFLLSNPNGSLTCVKTGPPVGKRFDYLSAICQADLSLWILDQESHDSSPLPFSKLI